MLTKIIAATAVAAGLTLIPTAAAQANEGNNCYENHGQNCEPPTPVPTSYNLIVGSRFDDTLFGTRYNDAIFGRGGDDRLIGRRGDDRLFGGRGDDVLVGGQGTDVMRGGFGNDTCIGDVDDSFINCETVIVVAD
jgi:Ca2+-binding RTX toxin-like protein